MKKRAITGVMLALCTSFAWSGEKEDAVKLVHDAAAAVAKDKSGSLAEIGKAGGHFVKGELYVFVYDMGGVMVAHPINPKLVGKSLLEVPDADGKMFRKDIISAVTTTGTATVDYKYKNPTTGKVEEKITYCKKAADLAVCAGYYK